MTPLARRALCFVSVVAITWAAVPGAAQAPGVRLVRDEADAALAILSLRARSATPVRADWSRLFQSEGYRRLARREASMGRPMSDSAFQFFLLSDTMAARAPALARTLEDWSRMDVGAAARRALAYLPAGTRLHSTIFPLIKPRTNSFVFDVGTDSAAIFLYLDPAVSRAKLENTVAHELHHIGYASACSARPDSTLTPRVRTARQWLGAFGEGIAVLAAAGGPGMHPHAVSDSAERARWERDYANAADDLRKVQAFLMDVLNGTLEDPVAIRERGMSFFGDAQGAWYTVGYLMGLTIEQARGRAGLVEVLCDPARLLRRYNEAALTGSNRVGDGLPLWSTRLLTLLGV